MARPLRIEFAGAFYHVTSRGNDREAIYRDDGDRRTFLEVVGQVCERFNWIIHAYCLMGNHYHLLVETPDGNLSRGMRQLNGVYTQWFNRTHDRVGHVFQGRYKAILVQKDSYLLELARYIVLNPVRARMMESVKEWPWSSYRTTAGQSKGPKWLQTDPLLSTFDRNRRRACERYQAFVADGKGQPSPWTQLKNQIYLGSAHFVETMQVRLDSDSDLREIPAKQRRGPVKCLKYFAGSYPERDIAIVQAYASGGYSMKEIGDYFGLHYSYISRIIRRVEKTRRKT